MKFGFVLPFGNARVAADFAREAETAGWDGFFVWEPIWGVDAWVALTAAAMQTERIRLGTLLSPLSRMRPWKLASEAVTLDRLSQGRVIISIGLGAPEVGFADFGEETDLKTRAELLDESLDIIEQLWTGKPFVYQGKHYQVNLPQLPDTIPLPFQTGGIPIWSVGAWKRPKSMQRVLRCDGLLPYVLPKDGEGRPPTHAEVREMKAWVEARRTKSTPFDIIVEGETPGDAPEKGREITAEWSAAGATWWIEARWNDKTQDEILTRIRQGPPR
jgi:alkanesulfonate monooxygenase SsuD/methylene tetrahydromethanopterin reductase-like flavin-dependent oxidoreductase (luciferase family)